MFRLKKGYLVEIVLLAHALLPLKKVTKVKEKIYFIKKSMYLHEPNGLRYEETGCVEVFI